MTNEGRIIGVFVIIAGVGLFSAFTGYLANSFINRRKRRGRLGMHFNAQSDDPLDEIRQILEEQGKLLGLHREAPATPSHPALPMTILRAVILTAETPGRQGCLPYRRRQTRPSSGGFPTRRPITPAGRIGGMHPWQN